jgi:hypothetical protein
VRAPRRPDPEPLQVDMQRHVAIGTALWALAFLVLLPFSARLRADGHLWWLGTCAAGVGLGLLGLAYLRRREHHEGPRRQGEA